MSNEVELPFGGVSDELAFDRQKAGTCRTGTNMQGWDPIEQRAMMSRRSGQSEHGSGALTSGVVRHLCDHTFDNPATTYTALGDSVTTDWDTALPSNGACRGIVTDELGNHYALDGNAGVVKYSPDGHKVWLCAAPSLERGAVLRAVAHDSGLIIFAVSEGGDPDKARILCFEEIEENKTKLLWQIPDADPEDQEPEDVGWFTEALIVDGTSLYAFQNDTVNWKSRVAVYTDLGVPNPTRVKTWDISYPVNDAHISPVDGAIATAHEPNTSRGNDPRSPETTGPLEDATIQELVASHGARIWSWHSSADVDGDGTNNANRLDGEFISTWADKSGNGRSWFQRGTDTVPQLRKNAIAGRDAMFFNGTDCSMIGAKPLSTSAQFKSLNKSPIPNYAKSQFVLIMAFRAPHDTVTRIAFGQAKSNVGSVDERAIALNSSFNAGVIIAPGNVLLYEQPLTGSGQSGRVNGASGFTTILPGTYDADGLCLVTYVFDHGYDDIAGTPTRSQLRVNGRPVDRWTSRAAYESLEQAVLGAFVYPNGTLSGSRFKGDILEFLCLSDWAQTGFGQTSATAQQALIAAPIYPDSVWGSGSDTTLERLEGLIAHRVGMAHKLPTGNAAVLEALAAGNVNDTITLDGQVFTLKAAPTTTAYEVKIGANAFGTLLNLSHAINGTGTPGTDYGSATPKLANLWCAGVAENGTTSGPALFVQRRDARVTSTFSVAESTSTVRFNWVSGANSVTSLNGSGRNFGHYPHPFFLYKTAQSPGGPPRLAGVGTDSLYSGLISPYGILAVWDPANGRLKAMLTTGGPGQSGLGYGGIGYGVRFNSAGDLYCTGPRQAAVSSLSISADNVDVRKVPLLATGFVVTNGSTATTAWTAAPGAQTYKYPRMAVDKWDNLYVPAHPGSNGTSLLCYRRIAPSSSPDSALIYTVTSLTDDPRGYAVTVDVNYPELPSAFTLPRAERVVLGTELFSTSNPKTLYALRELSTAPSGNAPSTTHRFAVCGGGFYKVNAGTSATTIDGSAFSSAATFIDSCSIEGKLVLVDGNAIKFYDPKTGLLGFLRARSGGEIPKRPRLTARYKNRLFFGAFADFPYRIAGSVAGDMFGWDFDPKGDDPLPVAAYRSDLTTTGDHPENVTALAPHQDDWLVVGGPRSVFVLVGDPMMGGQLDQVWQGSGIAFGRAWCFTPDKSFWFITNEAELAVMQPGQQPRIISRAISKRLAASLDFTKFRPRLVWDRVEHCIRIFCTPTGAGTDVRTDWTYWPGTGAFWDVTYSDLERQPTAAAAVDGATAGTRLVLLGMTDGKVRQVDASAGDDDGKIISAVLDIAPLSPQGAHMDALFSDLTVVTSRTHGTAQAEFLILDNPDDEGDAVDTYELLPGYNTPSSRVSGQFVGLRISSGPLHERFALQRISMSARPVGRARARA